VIDIVDRLRGCGCIMGAIINGMRMGRNGDTGMALGELASDALDADDEIDRLRSEIDRLRSEIIKLKAVVPAWKLIEAGFPDNFTDTIP
jgi:hypothetical protein